MEAIYGEKGIKAGFTDGIAKQNIIKAAKHLIDNGAEALLAGCTEIPLVISQQDFPVLLIDPMDVIARIAITKCLGDYCIR